MSAATMAIEETFDDVALLVYDTAHKFVRRYGGEIDEVLADAQLFYMNAYYAYDDSKGKFSYWIRQRIWYNLLEGLRKKMMRKARCAQVDCELDTATEQSQFHLFEFVECLSEDSREVVEVLFSTPGFVFREECPETKSPKDTLRRYLRKLGWASCRITEAFAEIASVLKDFP